MGDHPATFRDRCKLWLVTNLEVVRRGSASRNAFQVVWSGVCVHWRKLAAHRRTKTRGAQFGRYLSIPRKLSKGTILVVVCDFALRALSLCGGCPKVASRRFNRIRFLHRPPVTSWLNRKPPSPTPHLPYSIPFWRCAHHPNIPQAKSPKMCINASMLISAALAHSYPSSFQQHSQLTAGLRLQPTPSSRGTVQSYNVLYKRATHISERRTVHFDASPLPFPLNPITTNNGQPFKRSQASFGP